MKSKNIIKNRELTLNTLINVITDVLTKL